MRTNVLIFLFLAFASKHLDGEEIQQQDCRANLYLMSEAISIYRMEHAGNTPASLGELYGDYLSEKEVLRCPATHQSGDIGSGSDILVSLSLSDGHVDGYRWEMNPNEHLRPNTNDIVYSYKEFKELQMQTSIGPHVPWVRCGHHEVPDQLNLTPSGQVYGSDAYWETKFVHILPWTYHCPDLVTLSIGGIQKRLLPRSPKATQQMINLRPFYNGKTDEPWIIGFWGQELPDFIAQHEDGIFWHEGIGFDTAGGVLQLNGGSDPERPTPFQGYTHYPSVIEGIPIGRGFSTLHLLAGTLFEGTPEELIGTIDLLDQNDNVVASKELCYDKDLSNLIRPVDHPPETLDENSKVAWAGSSELDKKNGAESRFFHIRWSNPHSSNHIASLRFRAADSISSPFILGMTTSQ